jgi:hypothetical protein
MRPHRPPSTPLTPIQMFFARLATDDKGRSVSDYWIWSPERLESCHDYIQWAFPLTVSSAHNANAPILTEADILFIRSNEMCQATLARNILMMRRFYEATLSWRRSRDHNHLRISRILQSTLLLDASGRWADVFLHDLLPLIRASEINPTSRTIWAEISLGISGPGVVRMR